MKHIFLNLKRFDITPELGGVNRLAEPARWGETVASSIRGVAEKYADVAEFAAVPPGGAPRGRLPPAPRAARCRSAARASTGRTPPRAATSAPSPPTAPGSSVAKAIGLRLRAHRPLRGARLTRPGILAEAGVDRTTRPHVNRILNQEIQAARRRAGLTVLYCIGEKSEEQDALAARAGGASSTMGLDGRGQEPGWSSPTSPSGPSAPARPPPTSPTSTKIARFVKERTGGLDVVYGGGLKADNAEMLASIAEIDGGLIALTRFSGEIGFYPDEYLDIIRLVSGQVRTEETHETGL